VESARDSDEHRRHGRILEILFAYGWVLAFVQLRVVPRLRRRRVLPAEGQNTTRWTTF